MELIPVTSTSIRALCYSHQRSRSSGQPGGRAAGLEACELMIDGQVNQSGQGVLQNRKHGDEVRPLHTDAGMPLGLLPCEFTEHTVTFCHDFRLLFYTDGISEALNHEDQEFGSDRLMKFVAAHDCSTSQLMEALKEFRGKCAQADDATLILLRSN
jgi:Stage II sporulation protein E (SpoIIE)